MVNRNKLKSKIVEENWTTDEIAAKIGMNPSTFYRKLRNGKFYIKEVAAIVDALSLTKDEAVDIFFANCGA